MKSLKVLLLTTFIFTSLVFYGCATIDTSSKSDPQAPPSYNLPAPTSIAPSKKQL